jgi:hypothetical protein
VVVAGALRLLAGLERVRREEREVRDHAVDERGRDLLALPVRSRRTSAAQIPIAA